MRCFRKENKEFIWLETRRIGKYARRNIEG